MTEQEEKVEAKLVEQYMAHNGWQMPNDKSTDFGDYDVALETVKWFMEKIKQAGYVQLDEDQSFPDTIYGRILKMEAAEVVNDIYRLGFRRIKQ